ncbi:uncharacterized protein LOC119594221 [Penaeus monodon]|uniref:uncharacterized protein LOC119594221 n=1 Tax=Penaeus monodon TaxID=6687 RepID=UPI0018A786FF|nr:uncharacterized protein LOC119594221 [Penaeus monodon]
MGEEVRLLTLPAAFLALVLLVAFCDRRTFLPQAWTKPKLTPQQLASLRRDLNSLSSRMQDLEAGSSRTGRELRLLKKVAQKVEDQVKEKRIIKDMCGAFFPCHRRKQQLLPPASTTVLLGRLREGSTSKQFCDEAAGIWVLCVRHLALGELRPRSSAPVSPGAVRAAVRREVPPLLEGLAEGAHLVEDLKEQVL